MEKVNGFFHYKNLDSKLTEVSFKTHRMRCFFTQYMFKFNSLQQDVADVKKNQEQPIPQCENSKRAMKDKDAICGAGSPQTIS